MPQPKLAAMAVVLRDDHVLLVRRKKDPDAGLWGYPGGHVEWGEAVGAAACRELQEETTILASPRETLTALDIIVPDTGATATHHYYLVAVLCDYQSGSPQARDDVSDAAWVQHSDVFDGTLELSKSVADVLRLALARKSAR
ncbi:MAG: NUDIX hydrolase [Pseudomonadota bacterium]